MAEDKKAAVFIVDDDVGLVRLMERALRREGYGTESAVSGNEAIDRLTRESADLLLLDLKLPDMEGGDVISRFESLQRKIPFIIITGQGDERVAVDMMKRGALDYVVKDANFLELLVKVVGRALAQLSQEKRLAAAEASARESQELTQAVLNSLSARIAVLDKKGAILAVNQPWTKTASGDCDPGFALARIGDNYLEICQQAAARGEQGAEQVHASIDGVLYHGEEARSVEYHYDAADAEHWFLTTVTPLTAIGGGAVVTHVDISNRKRLEAEVLEIAESERQRVAFDLHDGICQELTGIGFRATAIQRELAKEGHPLSPNLTLVEQAIAAAVAHTRQVARGLIPVVPEGLGLMHALHQLASTTAQLRRMDCSFECARPVPIDDPVVANELYRIAQEAVTNAAQHGHAGRIVLKLANPRGEIRLTVEDDGKGVPVDSLPGPGMGLRIMHYRAGRIRGQLTVRPRKPRGTEVICRISNSPRLAPLPTK
jgi:signal transduction histidine kinase